MNLLPPNSLCYLSYYYGQSENANTLLEVLLGCRLHKRSQHKVGFATNLIRNRQKDIKAKPRCRMAECPGLLRYLLCFLCFLAAETGTSNGAWNSLPETPLPFSSFLYVLRSSVRVLWVLTDFWSVIGTPADADHQLSNAGSLTSLTIEARTSRIPI